MRIMLVGGGTGGPVVPLLAVQQRIKKTHPQAQFLLVGANTGPERQFAEKYGLKFVSVNSGKWRRYFSPLNILAPFQTLLAFFKALRLIKRFKPNVVFAAGGYVSVPIMYAAWLLRRKIIIHQQDVFSSMSNKIIAPIADKITVSFENSMKDFSLDSGFGPFRKRDNRIVWTGNPVREELYVQKDLQQTKAEWNLNPDMPVLLLLGGATGALALNEIILQALPELVKFVQIIHSTGKSKGINFSHENYHPYELITDMADAYAVSDLVVSRAGLSTITELSALAKVSIIIPIPDSHQEYNAFALGLLDAAICLNQKTLNAEHFIAVIRKVLYDGERQRELRENIYNVMPHDATEKLAKIITDLCNEKK